MSLSWTFLGKNAAAIVSALDKVTDVRTLSAPSVFTQNNREASLNVGQRIPISSVSFNPSNGNSDGTYSQVQYLETGIILKVRPRITRDGMVFLDIVQEVSKPTRHRRRQRQRAHRHQQGAYQRRGAERRDHHAGGADHRRQRTRLHGHSRAEPDPDHRWPVRPAEQQHHAR